MPPPNDETLLRRAFDVAKRAREHGNHPFGAILTSEARLKGMTGAHPENPTLSLPCRTVFAPGQRAVDVVGPLLEDEAAAQHDGVWD